MVRTGKCGVSRKIEGIKNIVLVGLCVSAAQDLRAIMFLLSGAHRISEFLQQCCKVKGFKKSCETACSHCFPLYCFQVQNSAHALAQWTCHQPSMAAAFRRTVAPQPRLHFRRGPERGLAPCAKPDSTAWFAGVWAVAV